MYNSCQYYNFIMSWFKFYPSSTHSEKRALLKLAIDCFSGTGRWGICQGPHLPTVGVIFTRRLLEIFPLISWGWWAVLSTTLTRSTGCRIKLFFLPLALWPKGEKINVYGQLEWKCSCWLTWTGTLFYGYNQFAINHVSMNMRIKRDKLFNVHYHVK